MASPSNRGSGAVGNAASTVVDAVATVAGAGRDPLAYTPSHQRQTSDNVTIFRRSVDLPPPNDAVADMPRTASSGLSETRRQPVDSHVAVTDLSQGSDDSDGDEYKNNPTKSPALPTTGLEPMSIDSSTVVNVNNTKQHITTTTTNQTKPTTADTAAEPLLKPHPNWQNPNVDLSRGLSTPYPSAQAEPHVVTSALPWLQRWVDKRWRVLFPAYRRLDVWGLRGFSVCELIFITIYGLVNLALIISGIAQCATVSHTPNGNGGGGPHGNGGGGQGSGNSDLYNVGIRFGDYGTINVLLLLFPIARSNVWQYILGMSFERSVFYHKWIARVAIAELAIHGAAIYADSYYNNGILNDAYNGGVTGEYGSGSIAFFIGVAIVLLSLYPFRRYLHESFLRVHMVLFLAFIVFGFIHDGTVAMIVPALILYAIDWVLRISMWRKPVRVLSVKHLPGGVTRIVFQKDRFTYQAGQYIFICIPAVSPFEWHPYTLSSSPHHPTLTVHCKTIGRWTRRLAELAKQGEAEGRDWTKLRMHTEGPYGQLSLPLARYSSVLLVCGGIGVTPLGSIYNDLVHEHYRGTRRLRQLKLVWSLRQPALISSLYDDVRKAEAVAEEEQADAAGEQPSSFYFHPKSLAQRDALVKEAAAAITPRRKAASPGPDIQPLTGRINNAFHVTQVDSSDIEQLRGVQSYYGEWVKEGRPELAQAFAEMRTALVAQADEEQRLSGVTVVAADGSAESSAVTTTGQQQQQSSLELGINRCAVLACGPKLLIEDVRALCIRQSSKLVRFDLHEEEFSW